MKAFDRKFGKTFLSGLPAQPGIYRVYDAGGRLIYIGKAKNLRRRLSQYRNAKRRKKHAKMRSIVGDADRIEIETCGSDQEACLLEAILIRDLRPRWNVAGAFHFLYPLVGVREADGYLDLCFTTQPSICAGYTLHGAFRSREICGEAFFSLIRLLAYVGHPVPSRRKIQRGREGHSYFFSFRRIPSGWHEHFGRFLRGESPTALEELVLALIENAGARRSPRKIQDALDALKRFYRHEALPLARARKQTGFAAYPVPQRERDLLFMHRKFGRSFAAQAAV